MSAPPPAGLPGVLDRDQVAATGAAIARVQERDGALPWSEGAQTDTWNHVEAAMGLLLGGQPDAARRAYDWCLATQRPDGSWPMRVVGGVVEDGGTETNMCAYLAVGVWHHWLLHGDERFARRCWPAVRRGLDLVCSLQLPFGGIAWSREAGGHVNADALLAGSASIHQALAAGLALGERLGDPQPEWELAAGRLGHALREHRDLFLPKQSFAMDWYYPVLGGAVRGRDARALLETRWDDFVVEGYGVRCVDTNAWVTAAETCELVLALDAVGERDRALRLLRDVQHLRAEDGGYWTGYVVTDATVWPRQLTTYTAGAVLLAVDALAGGTPAAGLFRGDGLRLDVAELALQCGCEPALSEAR